MTVYIAHIPDYRMIKIGFTTQLEKRIKAIPGEVPGPRIYGKRTLASVLRTFEGDRKLESALHLHFRGHRVGGEFYCDSILDAATQLSPGQFPQLLQQYWATYPKAYRPTEFKMLPQVHILPEAIQMAPHGCVEHEQCRRRSGKLSASDLEMDRLQRAAVEQLMF